MCINPRNTAARNGRVPKCKPIVWRHVSRRSSLPGWFPSRYVLRPAGGKALKPAFAVVIAVVAISTLAAIGAGYAFDGDSRTYNEGNSADMQYITVSLGDGQYSSAVNSEIKYHTEIIITQSGRTVTYIPEHAGSITIDATAYPVTEVVQFDISVASDSPGPLPTYSLSVTVDDSSKMHGTFIASYWTNPSDEGTRVNVLFPPAGIQINNLTTANVKFCLFVSTEESDTEPAKPLDDIAFKFWTTTGA